MNFKPAQLENFCKNPDPRIKCVILFGNNEGAMSIWNQKCAEAVCDNIKDGFRYTALDMDNISKDGREVYAEFYSQSLMGGRRVITVKNADGNLTDFIKKNIPDSKSDNLLILTSLHYNTKSALIVWANNRDDVIACGLYAERDSDIYKDAATILQQHGLTATPQVLQLLCARLSPDNKINQNEIAKLAEYLGERKVVTIEDVHNAVSDVAGANIEDLCYYIAGGKVARACKIFERLLKEGEDAATLIKMIAYHFNKLLDCLGKINAGSSIDNVIKNLRPPLIYYRKDDFTAQLKIWNAERVFGALQLLYECERDCKTTAMPAEQIAAHTILRLASAAQKLAAQK